MIKSTICVEFVERQIGVCVFGAAASVVALFYFREVFMENIGVKREIDGNGRLCIPKEMRTLLKLENEVELVATKDGVLIRNPRYVLVERKDLIKNTDKR